MMGYSFTKIRKGLARRKPEAQVKAHSLRKRRMRDRKRLAKLAAAGFEPPPELQSVPYGKTGRPRLSDDEITLQRHAHALRWRIYTQMQHAEAAEPLALLAAVADADEAAAEAQAAAALQSLKLRKLERQLDARNASDGVVADGPGAIRLHAFARDDECACAICLPCDETDESGPCDARRMRCCGARMCAESLGEWLRRNTQWIEMGYEDGVQGVQHVRRGRKLWARMNTHTCPVCRRAVQSVRRGLI
jgi:hypothetical protein